MEFGSAGSPDKGQRGHVPPAFEPGRRLRLAAVCPRDDPGAARWLEGARAAALDVERRVLEAMAGTSEIAAIRRQEERP